MGLDDNRISDLKAAQDKYQALEEQRNNFTALSEQVLEQLEVSEKPFGEAVLKAILAKELGSMESATEGIRIEGNIQKLNQAHAELHLDKDAGLLAKSKAKAKQTAIAAKIKLEEAKFGKQYKLIGQQIISTSSEESVRCDRTRQFVERIAELRAKLNEIQSKKRDVEEQIKIHNQFVAEIYGITDADSLSVEIEQSEQAVAGDVRPRAQMSNAEAERALSIAEGLMLEDLSGDAEKYLEDFLIGQEDVIYKLRSSPDGDRSQVVLTSRNLFIFSKGIFGGQGQDTGGGILGAAMARGRMSIRIYPISSIEGVEIQPPKGMTVGHFQILTRVSSEQDNETKFLLDTEIGYFKCIHLFRKLVELQSQNKPSI